MPSLRAETGRSLGISEITPGRQRPLGLRDVNYVINPLLAVEDPRSYDHIAEPPWPGTFLQRAIIRKPPTPETEMFVATNNANGHPVETIAEPVSETTKRQPRIVSKGHDIKGSILNEVFDALQHRLLKPLARTALIKTR